MEISLDKKLSSLLLISQKKFENILSTCGEKKDLIIDPSLIAPFERVCGMSWLRQNGIDRVYKLEPKIVSTGNPNRLYLLPSCLIKLKHVLDQMSGLLAAGVAASSAVVVVPRALTTHHALLEEEGLVGLVRLHSFQWELIRLDRGILSLELPFMFREVVGKPDLLLSLGKHSTSVLEMYDIYKEAFHRDGNVENESEFGAVIIVDRDQDYASTLLTPATYSGLLHEVFDVTGGKLRLDVTNAKYKKGHLDLQAQFRKADKTEEKVPYMILDGETDSIYAEIRYRHFSTVFSVLSAKAKALNSESSNISDLGISQMKQYVTTKLHQIITDKRSLSDHLLACEAVVAALGEKFEDLRETESSMLRNRNKKANLAFVEENFCTDVGVHSSLRLFCLLSLTQGLTTEEYCGLITKYLHAFDYKFLHLFENLISAGLVVAPASGKIQLGLPNLASIGERLPRWYNNFQTAANRLHQLPAESDDLKADDPVCPAFVFSGSYLPLVAALTKVLFTCENVDELVAKLSAMQDLKFGGVALESSCSGVDNLGDRLSQLSSEISFTSTRLDVGCKDAKVALNLLKMENGKKSIIPLRPKAILIFIVGGVTHAEIAACHLQEKLTGGRIVLASDCVISGDSLMQAAV